MLNKDRDDTRTLAGLTDIRWLVLGAVAGLLAAAYGILRQDSSLDGLPENAVARVNDTMIDRDRFARALARYQDAGEQALTMEDKAGDLQGLVDEELLLQRGIDLGMAQSDVPVRAAINNTLVASLTAEADAASPSDDELREHLAKYPERFSYTAGISVEAWQTDDGAAAQIFADALRQSDEVPTMQGIDYLTDLPASVVPVESLREYLGAGIAAAAANMPAGGSAVFAHRGHWLIVRIVQKEAAVISDLDSIRNRVLLDYRRDLADTRLRQYLDELRDRAEVSVALP
jgi:hypothetical protein